MRKPSKRTLAELYNVPGRFLRSVHLERDFTDPHALENYVVTPAMAEALARVRDGLRPGSTQRAWRITGDYGAGKSSFALLLAHLLSGSRHPQTSKIAAMAGWSTEHSHKSRLLPILVTGAREGIGSAILRGVRGSLESFHGTATKLDVKAIRRRLPKSVEGNDIEAVEELLTMLRGGASKAGLGVLLIVDELGKLLEHAAQEPERQDVFVLQRLAELAARSGAQPFIMIGLLHQGFQAYAERLPVTARHEWDKVAGRFEEIVFDQPLAHTAVLVGGALGVNPSDLPDNVTEQGRAAARATGGMGWLGGGTTTAATMDATSLYPLHPTLLPPLVRFFARFGQNERSLFSFLLSSEPFGLQAFSKAEEIGSAWYALSNFYDYVRANFGHRLAGQSYQNQWLRIVATIDANSELPELDIAILKTVGLLNLLDADDLLPTARALTACFSWARKNEVGAALERLTKNAVLFSRGERSGYRLWPNASINLAAAYDNAKRALGDIDKVAANLAPLLPGEPVLARRHYLETGTMRYFDVRYVPWDGAGSVGAGSPGSDGMVLLLLCDTPEQRDSALDSAAALSKSDERLVFGVPRSVAYLGPEVLAVRAWEWVRDNTPELSDDIVAAEEVSRLVQQARQSMISQVEGISGLKASSADRVDWVRNGEALKLTAGLTNELSLICAERFSKAPLVTNELINRNAVSSAAASARMRLIEGMFEHVDKPLFGIDPDKAPPEKSMYLSIFKAGHLHVEAGDNSYTLSEPDKKDPLRLGPSLKRIIYLIRQGLGGRVPVKQLFDDLRGAPYGVRDGLAPLLLAIVLKLHGHELAIYENGTFLAGFNALDFMRLSKAPATFDVQYCSVEGVRSEVFERLAHAFAQKVKDRRPVLLDVVTELSQFAARLPEYTRKARGLAPSSTAVRDALLTATEPATLLFQTLPKACGHEPFALDQPAEASAATDFVRSLTEAINDLQTAYQKLLERLVLRVAEALGSDSEHFDRVELAGRAARVSLAAKEIRLRTFALRLRDTGLSDDAWVEALASFIVARSPAKWQPGDEARFGEEVGGLAELFTKVEAAAFSGDKSAVSPDAVRVNLTLPDGQDFIHVVNDTKLTPQEEILLSNLSSVLPHGDRKRIQFLANLLLRELNKEKGAVSTGGLKRPRVAK